MKNVVLLSEMLLVLTWGAIIIVALAHFHTPEPIPDLGGVYFAAIVALATFVTLAADVILKLESKDRT